MKKDLGNRIQDQNFILAENPRLIALNRELRAKIIQSGGPMIEPAALPSSECGGPEDILAKYGILTDERDSLIENLLTLPGSSDHAPIDHFANLADRVSSLQKQVTQLEGQVTERNQKIATLESKCADFDLAVVRETAARVASLGINPKAVAKVIKTPAGTASTATEPGKATGKNWTAIVEQHIAEHGPTAIGISL